MLAPVEYGLVVVDLAGNRIVTSQGAARLEALTLFDVVRSVRDPARARAELEGPPEGSLTRSLRKSTAHPSPRAGEIWIGESPEGHWFAERDSDAAHAAALHAMGRLIHLELALPGTVHAIDPGGPSVEVLDALRVPHAFLWRDPNPWASILAHLRIDWSPRRWWTSRTRKAPVPGSTSFSPARDSVSPARKRASGGSGTGFRCAGAGPEDRGAARGREEPGRARGGRPRDSSSFEALAMHTLALNAPAPRLGFRYGDAAHRRTLHDERPVTREATTPVRPLMSAVERAFVAAERHLYLMRRRGAARSRGR